MKENVLQFENKMNEKVKLIQNVSPLSQSRINTKIVKNDFDNEIEFIECENLGKIEKLLDECIYQVNNVPLFEASEKEIELAKKLVNDKTFELPDLSHIKSKWGVENYNKLIKLLNEYSDVFAKHRYDFGKVKNFEFELGIIEEKRNEIIYTPQYPLTKFKRLAYIYDTLKRLNAGIIEENNTSPHNIATIIISKKKEDGSVRYRPARDYHNLNKIIRSIECNLPLIKYADWVLSGKGTFLTFDLHSFFDSIVLCKRDRDHTKFTSPVGSFVT